MNVGRLLRISGRRFGERPLFLFFAIAIAGASATATAQPGGGPPGDDRGGTPEDAPQVTVHRLSHLDFGIVTAGRERVVAPSSPDAAHFEVSAPPATELRVQWELPSTLGGVPLSFHANSAAWSPSPAADQQFVFDPNHDTHVTVPASRSVFLWLGGLARPSSHQASGEFRENISLTITLEHE